MFKYSVTSVINTIKDYTTGLPLFEGLVGETQTDGTVLEDRLKIKRGLEFKKSNIQAIYHRGYREAVKPEYKVALATVAANPGIYRISLYVTLSGSQDERYANTRVLKGKPIFVEFEVTAKENTAALVADKVVAITKKYLQMVYEDKIINIVKDSTTGIIIKGISGEQRFSKVALEKWENNDWIVLDDVPGTEITVTAIGDNGFGTYRNIIKDLRLPTAANTQWTHIAQDEIPVVGGVYDQYTIVYCVHRGVLGSDAVGDDVTSITEHVFYVKSDVIPDWKAALANAKLNTSVTEVDATVAVKDIKEPTELHNEKIKTEITAH